MRARKSCCLRLLTIKQRKKIMSTVIIRAKREKYSPEECETLTVAELIRKLERLDPSAKVVLSHDGGHTYGGILQNDIKEA